MTFISDTNELKNLANDISFWQALDRRAGDKGALSKVEIYFDTAAVMDMLLGWDIIFRGGQIKWNLFKERPSILVNALAYKNWLGTIHLLHPHTEELVNKILHDDSRFPDAPAIDLKGLGHEFWVHLDGDISRLASRDPLRRYRQIEALRNGCVAMFKGVFLGSEGGFWKRRYKWLKDNQILRLSSDSRYNIREVTSRPLFQRLLTFLNEKRSDRPANNYLDATALCLLDEKLRQFVSSEDPTVKLPIFFSDQKDILSAIEYVSHDHSLREGNHFPFTYQIKEGDRLASFSIVRSTGFFLVSGVGNAMRHEDLPDLLKTYTGNLENLRRRVNSESIESLIQDLPEESIWFEFFRQWWTSKGYGEVVEVMRELVESVTQEEVNSYIKEERERLRRQFDEYNGRIDLIRKIWDQFQELPEFVKRNFNSSGIDVYKEIGARLYYSEEVCKQVQERTNRILRTIKEHPNSNSIKELDDTEDTVTDLIAGIFDHWHQDAGIEDKLNHLARGLAVLWVFERFDLINEVCIIIREQFIRHNPDAKERYPAPSIALIHAAAILRGRTSNQDQTLDIIRCLEDKFCNEPGNYNVWIGLSYIHSLIWSSSGGIFDFSEFHYYRTGNRNYYVPHRQNLEEGLNLCKRAWEWIGEENKREEKLLGKKNIRSTKWYYAVNNYLYMLAICGDASTLRNSLSLAESFQGGASPNMQHAWQAARFSDTLACYYLRMAFLSETSAEFERHIKKAVTQNESSIVKQTRHNEEYAILQGKISEIRDIGFEKVKEVMNHYRTSAFEVAV